VLGGFNIEVIKNRGTSKNYSKICIFADAIEIYLSNEYKY
jgi:hypothetical protein